MTTERKDTIEVPDIIEGIPDSVENIIVAVVADIEVVDQDEGVAGGKD